MQREVLGQILKERVLVGDGAMGTLLQERGYLDPGECPDLLNLAQPDIVTGVHQEYIQAGSDFVQTNTFGANRVKLDAALLSDKVAEINILGAEIAKKARSNANRECLIAGNIGPTGELLSPFGEITFREAEQVFYEQALLLIKGGVDFILIETMSDVSEAKAAVMGAKRASGGCIPIICSFTYGRELRTLTGADPETVATVLEGLAVDAIGINCGFGPDLAGEALRRQYGLTDLPILVQPNAGIPVLSEGRTIYPESPESFAGYFEDLIRFGAKIVGGCCGTTPEHIRLLAGLARKLKPLPLHGPKFSKLSGSSHTLYVGDGFPTRIVGERINPTGRKDLAAELRQKRYHLVSLEARKQVEEGAELVDINVGIKAPSPKESELMFAAVLAAQREISVPIVIDSSDVEAIERGLEVYRGKPLLNSTTGRREHMERITDLAARYGAALVGLTLDESGIPPSPEGRLSVARRIVECALSKGIRLEDIYIDPLTLTVGASQDQLMITLESLRLIKAELGVRTILGISNVSYGMPYRDHLNNVFLAMALGAGLDLPIINPAQSGVRDVILAADVLTNRDRGVRAFLSGSLGVSREGKESGKTNSLRISRSAEVRSLSVEESQLPVEDLRRCLTEDLIRGETERLEGLVRLLIRNGVSAMRIIDDCVVPAMETVGDEYERGNLFLPHLLLAAEAAQKTFEVLRPELQCEPQPYLGKVVLATVKGDIHDIGKSIFGLLLENHGFSVIDLGKDVDSELIVDTAISEKADIVALSSLMTTTMPEMAKVAEVMRSRGLGIPLLIGGAVVTAEYAESIGAHYGGTATQGVRMAKLLMNGAEE